MEFLGWKEEWKMAFNYDPVVTYLCVLIRTQGDSKKPWINKAIWGEKSLVATNQQKCCWGQGREENPKKQKKIYFWLCILCIPFIFHLFSWLAYKKEQQWWTEPQTHNDYILQKYRQCLQESDTADLKRVVTLKMSVYSGSCTFGSSRHMLFSWHESDRALSAYWRLSQV